MRRLCSITLLVPEGLSKGRDRGEGERVDTHIRAKLDRRSKEVDDIRG